MQHYIEYPTNSLFLCGADAVGRRNTRNDKDPALTTCRACKVHSRFPQEEPAPAAEFTQTNGRFAYTPANAS